MESLELGHGDEDDDSLLAALDLDLLGAGDLEGSELSLELRDVGLKVNESLSDNGLDLRGGAGGGVSSAENLLLDGSHDDYMRTESVLRRWKSKGIKSAKLAFRMSFHQVIVNTSSSRVQEWWRQMLMLWSLKSSWPCRIELNLPQKPQYRTRPS